MPHPIQDRGRYRTQYEPRSAAWSIDYGEFPTEHYGKCKEEGCKLAFRHHISENRTEEELSKHGRLDELVDFVPSGVDREGNEVSFKVWEALPCGREDDASERQVLPDCEDHMERYRAWFEEKTQNGRRNPHSRSRSFERHQEETADLVEHIAGVDCREGHGFNGNAISAEEMRLCNTAQYIVKKDSHKYHDLPVWTPEPDDEDFERASKYCLSGLADRVDSSEGDCSVWPFRHGLNDDEYMAPNDYAGFDGGDLVFHPHCLEIYKRTSALRLGGAELTHVPAFADWWDSDGRFRSPPCHESISACGGQWFEHTWGHEFIVANPLQIPALNEIFEAARRLHDFDAKERSPFGSKQTTLMNVNSDIFGKLPNELRDMVLSSLGSKDIANLRLASRTFRHLPTTLWCELIVKEMPWIWEAWSGRPYPFISCTTRPEFEAHDKATKLVFPR